MREIEILHSLSDDELLQRLPASLTRSRRVEADLVAHLAEVDARRLYAREAAPSMFAYATQVLHLSEHEAFLRISVARVSRQHPILLEMLPSSRRPTVRRCSRARSTRRSGRSRSWLRS